MRLTLSYSVIILHYIFKRLTQKGSVKIPSPEMGARDPPSLQGSSPMPVSWTAPGRDIACDIPAIMVSHENDIIIPEMLHGDALFFGETQWFFKPTLLSISSKTRESPCNVLGVIMSPLYDVIILP